MIKIIRAGYTAVWKTLVERAVVAEAGCDVSPFGEERLIGSAASDVAADHHRAEGTAVITLTSRNDAIARGLPAFEMKLPGELDGGFRGFRSA
jgi:hypothetical protein